jgi:hypothetical protein
MGHARDCRATGGRAATHSGVLAVSYRYELRHDDEIVATGHLTREQPLEVGDQIAIGSQRGIVRAVEPLLGESGLRLVVQLTRYGSG